MEFKQRVQFLVAFQRWGLPRHGHQNAAPFGDCAGLIERVALRFACNEGNWTTASFVEREEP